MGALFPQDERWCDVLATRAIEGLDGPEQEELDKLSKRYPEFDPDELDRAAAALALAGLRIEPMPEPLRRQVETDARAWFAQALAAPAAQPAPQTATVTPMPVRPRPVTAWGGWLAAAAAVMVAVVGWLQVERLDQQRSELAARQLSLEASVARLERAAAEKDAAIDQLREPAPEELLASLEARPGTLVLPWSATADPAVGEAGGAVVWNAEAQAGLMRIRGLEANNPAEAQYQLWIFDAERDDRFPVDGGVFDIPAGADEALVPIRARLPVGEAVLFAITVEAPGGVVVSSRERIALVAQPGA
jgi:hypothetical protein